MFVKKYNELNDSERENFKRMVSYLLAKTFIVNRIYDKSQKTFITNPDYRFISRNIELFREYLELAGFKLIKDSHYDVMYIENAYGYNKKRLDKNTTIFLYGLRLLFDEEQKREKLNTDTVVSVADIIKTLLDVGAYSKKPTDTEIKIALSNLIRFNIIQKVEGILEKPDTKIIILPSVLFVVSNEKIESLNQFIQSLKESEENEEIMEEEDEIK